LLAAELRILGLLYEVDEIARRLRKRLYNRSNRSSSSQLISIRRALTCVRLTKPPAVTRRNRSRRTKSLTIAEWAADYGDGKIWQVASLFEFSQDQVIRKTDYFVAGAQPPEWRRAMTDVLDWPAS
jgi:hypothetical protein